MMPQRPKNHEFEMLESRFLYLTASIYIALNPPTIHSNKN